MTKYRGYLIECINDRWYVSAPDKGKWKWRCVAKADTEQAAKDFIAIEQEKAAR